MVRTGGLVDRLPPPPGPGSCRRLCARPEVVEVQSEVGKTSIEGLGAEATGRTEIYAAAAKEAFAPLTARFTAAVEIVKDARV